VLRCTVARLCVLVYLVMIGRRRECRTTSQPERQTGAAAAGRVGGGFGLELKVSFTTMR